MVCPCAGGAGNLFTTCTPCCVTFVTSVVLALKLRTPPPPVSKPVSTKVLLLSLTP